MLSTANPYTPGQPVTDSKLFFGRRDLLVSVRDQLVSGRRLIVVAGARRMGKTSFLQRLRAELPDGFVPVRVGLADEPAKRFDWLVWRVAQAVARQTGELVATPLPEPAWAEYDGRDDRFLSEFWPQISGALGSRKVVLMLDDVDRAAGDAEDLLGSLESLLVRWREQDHRLACVVTVRAVRHEALAREYPGLFAGAHTVVLTALSSEDAIRLITFPVDGVMTYDQGVPRRLVELTSGHPYYLQLLCYEVFKRCASASWVNQHDVDAVISDLAAREIPEFDQLWEESSPQEQATLAALVSLRGARGVATAREIQDILTRGGARVMSEQVEEVLERLSRREVVERLGALSYRLRVAFLRDWLDRRLDLNQVVRSTRWTGPSRKRTVERQQLARERAREVQQGDRPVPEGEQPGAREEAKPAMPRRPGRGWIVLAGAVGLALILTASMGLWRPSHPSPVPTPPASATPEGDAGERMATPSPGMSITATAMVPGEQLASPMPTLTPTPTFPVILSRALPAIAYLSKPRKDGLWTIYLMGSDGSNRIPLIEASSDFTSAPSWSPGGDRLAFVSDRDGEPDIWVIRREGGDAVNLTHDKAKDNSPAWSPDGQRIAFASVRDALYWEIYVMQADGTEVQRLTWWEDASDLWPSWSPDGSRLAFASKRDGNWEIYTMARDGSDLRRLTDHPADDTHPAWSPDGSQIAFESTRDGYADIYVVLAGGGEATNLTRLAWATDLGPTWSPDGGRIAFYSDRNGNWDIWVMAADGSDVERLTMSDTQDQLPAWRP